MRTSMELRILTLLLCVSFVYTATPSYSADVQLAVSGGMTVDELKARFPNARLLQVEMDELERIRDAGSRVTEYVSIPIRVAQAAPEGPATNDLPVTVTTTNAVTNTVTVTNVVTNVIQQVQPLPVRHEPGRVSPAFNEGACHLALDLLDCDFGGDADVVLFVVIGVVVVAALVIYTVGYLGSVALGTGDYDYWWDLETGTSFLVGGAENGVMVSLKLSSGIVAADAHAGIAVEGGYLDMEVALEGSDDSVDLEGGYIMGGPAIRWAEGDANPSYISMELLGGTTEHEQVDVMSIARLGVSLGIGPAFRLGFHIGAMYLGLELDEGLVREDDNFTTILGGEVGVRF